MIAVNARQFNRFYWASSVLVFAIILLRCILVPFAHDEVATFNFYIQPGSFVPFLSHVDAMGHFFTCATGWMSYQLFGSSPLALRLPILLSFVVLSIAVFKINNLFNGTVPKLVLTSALIFSWNFIAFYSLARGYAVSMAFLAFALFYFFCYARHFSFRHFWKFVLFSQLALSANLTLVFVLLITTAMLVALQIRNKLFFKRANLLILLLHAALITFWIKFGFFLQGNGALYYGGGDGYWKTTFQSLIETVAFKNQVVTTAFLFLFALMSVYFVYRLVKEKISFLLTSDFALSFFALCGLIVSFYLLKKFFNVNYPEDRTGLFFYMFYVIALGFMINELSSPLRFSFLPLALFFVAQFVYSFNFRMHPWRIYETIPTAFYDKLLLEQSQNPEPVTIGGHRLREFIFGFMNYNSPKKLSYMTSPEALQMNCDYAVAYAEDKPWYDGYYNEIAEENDWGFRLIKRKVPLQREQLFSLANIAPFSGNYEYYNAFEKLDTTFGSVNPLLAEFEISVQKAPVPFNAWLVVQVDSKADDGTNVFVRVPLNLIKLDWNGVSHFKTCVVTGNIPLNVKRVVCYLWNIDKQEINVKINSFRLLRLNGPGVTEISKAKI